MLGVANHLCALASKCSANSLPRQRRNGWAKVASLPLAICISGSAMNFSQMKDERLLLFYDGVRQQVILDGNSRYRFASEGVRAYADKLREEMDRRRIRYMPIDWPSS
jgi:hypothetical protein